MLLLVGAGMREVLADQCSACRYIHLRLGFVQLLAPIALAQSM